MTGQAISQRVLDVARAIGRVLEVDYDEICRHEADAVPNMPPCDYCESSTCPGSLTEDHDADHERARLRAMAEAAIKECHP